MSFFLVKLLQSVDEITLAPDAQPPATRPPASWKNATGRKAVEQIIPTAHLTLHVKVYPQFSDDERSVTPHRRAGCG